MLHIHFQGQKLLQANEAWRQTVGISLSCSMLFLRCLPLRSHNSWGTPISETPMLNWRFIFRILIGNPFYYNWLNNYVHTWRWNSFEVSFHRFLLLNFFLIWSYSIYFEVTQSFMWFNYARSICQSSSTFKLQIVVFKIVNWHVKRLENQIILLICSVKVDRVYKSDSTQGNKKHI